MEIRRILKDSGSVYLHCDHTASHYLKLLMDTIFDIKNFLNEITWKRYAAHSLADKRFDNNSDILLLFAKNIGSVKFNPQFDQLDDAELAKKFPYYEKETRRQFQHIALEQNSNKTGTRIIQGKEVTSTVGWRWSQRTFDKRLTDNPNLIYWTRNGKPRYKKYLDEYKGRPTGNIWTDEVPYLSANDKEKTSVSYATQKPIALLERIIKASSDKGDIVLDPFCGCATTCVSAEMQERKWIGIDVSSMAYKLVGKRLYKLIDDDLIRPLDGKLIQRSDVPGRTDYEFNKNITKDEKSYLFEIQEGECNGCGQDFKIYQFEIDHIVPQVAGGGNEMENLQLLCSPCNRLKGARPMEYLAVAITARNKRLKKMGYSYFLTS